MSEPTGSDGRPVPDGGGTTPAPRRLDRAPGERYRGSTPATGPAGTTGATGPGAGSPPGGTRSSGPAASSRAAAASAGRGITAALAVALVLAIARALLGQLDLGIGTWVYAAFAGWLVALALIWGSGGRPMRRRPIVAALVAAGAILGGLLLEWLLARLGGGALGPLDYVNERYGLIAYAELAVAGVVAGLRAR